MSIPAKGAYTACSIPSFLRSPALFLIYHVFLSQYTQWCAENGAISVATDLALSCVLKADELHAGVQNDPFAPPCSVREACLTLKEFFSSSPEHFNGEAGVASLGGTFRSCWSAATKLNVMLFTTILLSIVRQHFGRPATLSPVFLL